MDIKLGRPLPSKSTLYQAPSFSFQEPKASSKVSILESSSYGLDFSKMSPIIIDVRRKKNELNLLLMSEEEAKRSIVVSKIPTTTSAESVVIHFQKAGNGGGEIDRIHVSKDGIAVITFEKSEVMATVLQESHTIEESSPQLKVSRFVPDYPVEVFQRVKARVDFSKFNISLETSHNALKVMKNNAKVECSSRPDSKDHYLVGTFDQINTAHNLLRDILKGGSEGRVGENQHADRKINFSETSEIEAANNDFDSFEVQPLIMKLLHRVYETRLKEIKDVHGVNIIWEENANLVQICPATTASETFHKGSEEFISLYQDLYPKMRREEIELEPSDSRELATEDIRNLEAENNVVIEMKENKLVVYAEETNISVAVQTLKKTLGLLPGNRKGTRRGLRNTKSRSFQNTPSAQVLSQDLMNGVKLSLYQSDITDEIVDAIVNAANEWLSHGGGVAAAIVRKGGRIIQEESDGVMAQRSRCPLRVGDVVHTGAGTLPCKFVIHTVGPRWDDFDKDRRVSLLRLACIKSLCLAAQLELCSIALPPISSGIFGMPKDICAQVMFAAVEEFSCSVEAEFSTLREIRIVIIDDETINVFYEEFLKRYTSQVTTQTNTVRNEGEPQSPSDISSNVNKPPLPSETRSEDSHEGHAKENNEAKFPQGDQPSKGNSHPSGQISKAFEEDNKSELHTSTGIEALNVEIPTHGVDSEQGSKTPEISKEESANTTSKPSMGKGKSHLAIRFPDKPGEKGKPKAEADTRNIEHDTNVGNDSTDAFPPGMAVTEEGKRLAEAVSEDSNANHPSPTDKETGKEVDESGNQTLTPRNQSEEEEPPARRPNSNQEEISGFKLSHNGSMTDPNRNCDGSTEESLSGGKQPQNDENTHIHRPEDEQRDAEMDMEVEKSISDEKQNDVTQPQNALASGQSLDISGRQTIQERQDPGGGDIHASGRRAGPDPASLLKMTKQPDMSFRDCALCMNQHRNPVYGRQCGHYFCKNCISCVIEKIGICPQCSQEKLFPGNQPVGYMTWRTDSQHSLPGYEGCGIVVLTFNFQGGIQGSDHTNPGERFSERFCSAYLPNNPDGLEVCNLLRRAFNGRLIFTIGRSPTTGENNKIVLNDIELKTSPIGGPAKCGYPDPSYLDRVKKQLADKGVTPLHRQTFV